MANAVINMYDMAKEMARLESVMKDEVFKSKITEVAKEMQNKQYWMLLCRERNDYTVFRTINASTKKIKEELQPTLKNRGSILLMDKQPDGVWEIWIRDVMTSENFAYYLFDYTPAVIDCEV